LSDQVALSSKEVKALILQLSNPVMSKGMTRFREKLISIGEVWFDADPDTRSGIDVLHYYQRSQPITGSLTKTFHTMLLDLTYDQDTLWKKFGKTNRYKIKRASDKDELLYYYWHKETIPSDTFDEFLAFHDQFAQSQGLKKINRNRFNSFLAGGILDLSVVKSSAGDPLVWHAHCCTSQRACLFYSASLKNSEDTAYQSLLGRANRYHHWQDMLRFQQAGMALYDFGGWHTRDNPKLLAINQFKQEFGGEVIQNFKCFQGLTLKGKACVGLFKLLR
jgi:hypothetical protein